MHWLSRFLIVLCLVTTFYTPSVLGDDSQESGEEVPFELAFPDFRFDKKIIEYEGEEYLAFDKENSVLVLRMKKAYKQLKEEYRAMERVLQLEERAVDLYIQLAGIRKELSVTYEKLADTVGEEYKICEEERKDLRRALWWSKFRELILLIGLGGAIAMAAS